MPGSDETEVVPGTIAELREDGAVLYLGSGDRDERWLLAVPHEPGWGFHALWFSFISVDVFELEGRERTEARERVEEGERVGRWFIRLGSP
jgi:hypothetical protein